MRIERWGILIAAMLFACNSPSAVMNDNCYGMIEISPLQVEVAAGDSILVTATPRHYCTPPEMPFVWSVQDTSIATAEARGDSTGMVFGRVPGEAIMFLRKPDGGGLRAVPVVVVER